MHFSLELLVKRVGGILQFMTWFLFLGSGRLRLGLVVHAGADVLLPGHGLSASPDRLHDAILALNILRRACLLACVLLARRFRSEAGYKVTYENRGKR